MAEPRAERPYMPGYKVRADPEGMLSWPEAPERFSTARNYWLATTRPDGRPHLAPVWGVWLDGAFYFSTAGKSRKARNLASTAHCVVTPESADPAAIIVEGVARRVDDIEVRRRIAEVYSAKYDWPMQATALGVGDTQGNGGPLFVVQPTVAFGFSEDQSTTATRWSFGHE